MASTKISGMPAATTPLDGTELVPIVQGGANKKATVADFTGDIAGGADGEIPFIDSGILIYDATLKWDNTAKTLGNLDNFAYVTMTDAGDATLQGGTSSVVATNSGKVQLIGAHASLTVGDGTTTPTNAIICETEAVVPDADGTRDLGTITAELGVDRRWRNGYFSGEVQVGDTPFTFSEVSGSLQLGDSGLAYTPGINLAIGAFGNFITLSPSAITFLNGGQSDPGVDFAVNVSRGSSAVPVAVEADDRTFDFFVLGYDGASYTEMADLSVFVDGPVSAGIVPSRFVFTTMDAAGDLQQRITIDNAGTLFPRTATNLGKSTNPFGTGYFGTSISITPCAVGDLGSAATAGAGAKRVVNDALLPAFGATVANGGAVTVPVFSDGTNWKVG